MTERIPLTVAAGFALELIQLLEPTCERIVVAGSVRRRVATVKDIEIVAAPRIENEPVSDLWGGQWQPVDRLVERVKKLLADEDGPLTLRTVELHRRDGTIETSHRDGEAYKALAYRGTPVDLFIQRAPMDWGVLVALRTGPGDWNTRLVTECQRHFVRVAGGRVYHHGRYVPCPEEADFFRALGQPWIEPPDRHPNRVRLEWPAAAGVPA